MLNLLRLCPRLVLLAAALAGIIAASPTPAQGPKAPGEHGLGPGDFDSGSLLLQGEDGQLAAPRLRTEVTITVTGLLARAVVRQRFRNPSPEWKEGIYVFPLPEDAAVDRLRMQVGERIIEGRVEERKRAKQSYTQARAQGRRTSLVEQERANVFTTSVANIGPGEEVVIEIAYQHLVALAAERFSLRVPLVVAPRFIAGSTLVAGFAGSGWAANTDEVPDAARITPPVLHPAQGAINPVWIEVDLDMGIPVEGLRSHYHAARIEPLGATAQRVSLAAAEAPADRDFVLSWRAAAGDAPRAAFFSERGAEAEYGLIVLMPPGREREREREPVLARETIFVIDTSGSMGGESIRQAKAALALALAQLREADRFNIIQFNSRTSALYASPRAVTHATRSRGLAYASALRAHGGTVMAPAIEAALRDPGDARHLRQVVFLTDGSVGNEAALFERIRRDLGESRLFTVGIGSAPNAHFLRQAARLGRGTHTFIGAVAEVQDQMARLFETLSSPVLHSVSLRWPEGTAIEMWPERVPDLYLGEPLVVAFKASALPAQVTIEGVLRAARWEADLTLSGGQAGAGIGVLWARRKIAALTDLEALGEEADAVRTEITGTALAHGLVSKYTSLVAIDLTPDLPGRPGGAGLATRSVPVNLPAGWDYAKVFGALPGTATPGPLLVLAGLSLCLAALAPAAMRSRGRRRGSKRGARVDSVR